MRETRWCAKPCPSRWRMEEREVAEDGAEKERRVRGSNISVVVRARPLSHAEEARGLHMCIEVDTDGKHLAVLDPDDKMGGLDYLRLDKHRSRAYAFDRSLGPEVTQSQIFDASARGLLTDVLAGRNACCFAYGATGSGKTFTMTGSEEQPGLVTQTLDALFEKADATGDEYCVTCQYIEIYNETIKDLLCPSNGLLDVREGAEGTSVAGAASLTVHSREEVQALIREGNNWRATEATLANAVSSRSHAVLQLRVDVAGGVRALRHSGKLSMIDLAGSERARRTGVLGGLLNEGETNWKRLNEGAKINQSLLALANCIHALADSADSSKRAGAGSGPPVHVPYRDSKLTRLLKDSLGGCRTLQASPVQVVPQLATPALASLGLALRAAGLRCALGTSRCAAQGPMAGLRCGDEARPKLQTLRCPNTQAAAAAR